MARDEAQDIKTALDLLQGHERGDQIADLVARALLSRAERTTSRPDAEPGLADKLAEESELDKKERAFGDHDPFELLERGAKSRREAVALEALLSRGVSRMLAEADDDTSRRRQIVELLEQLDWLEATSAVSPYRGLSLGLDQDEAELFWREATRQLAADSEAAPPSDPTAAARRRTRLLVRAGALGRAPKSLRSHLATAVLHDVKASDIKRVALASLAGVDDATAAGPDDTSRNDTITARAVAASRAPKLEGEVEGPAWGLGARLAAAVTGVLLLRWLLRLLGRSLLGLRRTGNLILGATNVTLEHRTKLLGREIRSGTTTYALRSMRAGGREERFRYLHLLVGALALVIGVALGVNFMVEGACSSYPSLALFGLAVIGGGILLDILLEVLVPNKKGVTTVALDFGHRKQLRLRGVEADGAAAFVKEIHQLIPPPRTKTESPTS